MIMPKCRLGDRHRHMYIRPEADLTGRPYAIHGGLNAMPATAATTHRPAAHEYMHVLR